MLTSWTQIRMRYIDNGAIPIGGLAGGIGLAISFAGRGIIPGRVLGDPLPLALAATQVRRGFTYFNWRAPLYHALFALFLGVIATLALWRLKREIFSQDEARKIGRIAAVINVGVVALFQVDAFIVGFWYLMAGLMSLFLTTFIAGKIAQLMMPATR